MKYFLAIEVEHPRDIGADEQAEMLGEVSWFLGSLGFKGISAKFTPPPPGTDITEGTIYRMEMGRLGLGPNGVVLDSTKKDPAEFRGGAPEGQLTVVKVSGDVIAEGGHRTEVGTVQIGVDGRYRNHPDRRMRLRGVQFFSVLDPTRRPDLPADHDQQMVKQVAIAHDGFWLNGPYHLNEPGGPW